MSLVTQFNHEVGKIDPEVAAAQLRPLDRYLSEAVAPRRFSLLLLSLFGGAALALALTGIYAVMSYGVSQRAREIGIRIALGARHPDILRLVMGQGTRLIAIGVLCGMPLASAATRLLSAMLFGLTPNDAATFGQVGLIITVAALIACAAPAFRAMRCATCR